MHLWSIIYVHLANFDEFINSMASNIVYKKIKQMQIEVPSGYPFFTQMGWSSCQPEKCYLKFKLPCALLKKGDTFLVIALEKKMKKHPKKQVIAKKNKTKQNVIESNRKVVSETSSGEHPCIWRPDHF